MFRWGRASVAYGLIAIGAIAVGHGFERGSLFSYPGPWLPLAGVEAHAFSVVLGAAFAAAVVVGTRVLVENVGWAKNLHRDLRPMTLRLDGTGIAVIAGLSALAEELVFRGLLLRGLVRRMRFPMAAVISGVVFGLAHLEYWTLWPLLVGICGFGIAAAFVYRTMGFAANVTMHAVFNGIAAVFLFSDFGIDQSSLTCT